LFDFFFVWLLSKKVAINMIFELVRRRKSSGKQKRQWNVSKPSAWIVPWKFDILKTNIFALEASLLGQMFGVEYSFKYITSR